MDNKALYVEIREDLFDFVDNEVTKRRLKGDRGASKVTFIEELITSYKTSQSKK